MRVVILGSWKIRHAEPLESPERELILCAAPHRLQTGASIAADFRGQLAHVATYNGTLEPADGFRAVQNLSGDEVPLAIADLDGRTITISHLLTRVEVHTSHFLSVAPVIVKTPEQDLVEQLIEVCDREHLRLCNYECLYIKGLPDTELEFKFNIRSDYNFYTINRLFFEKLDRGEIDGFMPQLGDEIQHWSYDNNFCEILPNTEGVRGYVSIMYWSKKKRSNWDERAVTYKKKLFHEDTLERWERNYHNLTVEGTPEESLANYFNLPLVSCPDWRRTRLDIACEAYETGNIFFLNFEDSRIYNDSSPEGRLQQCEIEYHKTRGVPDERLIYRDFERLGQAMEQFMAEIGLPYQKTNYSKLTFLKEYMASHELAGRRREI
jgi:hypothetical protein